MIIVAATNPTYSKPDNTAIDCAVTFEGGTTVPYTAVPNDSTPYGVKLWEDLMANVYGGVAPYPAPSSAAKLDALAARRYDVQNGGVTIGGNTFDTDAESRSALIAAYMVANLNPAYSCNWKTASGAFVSLSAADIVSVGNGVLAFVQKCFDTEKAVAQAISGYTSIPAVVAAFDAAMASPAEG